MAEVMLTLGGYTFGLDTAAFQELNRSTEWNWPKQDVFGSRPVLQFTGWGEDTITLPGVIFPEHWGGTGQLDALRALGDGRAPQILIDGRGNILGEWVITSVQERQSVFAQRGVARRQEFTVTLKRYGDSAAEIVTAAAATAASAAAAPTVAEQASSAAATASSKAAQIAGTLTSAAANVQAMVGTIVTPVQGALNAIGQGVSAAQNIRRTALEAQAAVKALGSITNLSTAQAAMGGLMRVASNGAQTAAQASRTIMGTVDAMAAAGESAAAIATVRQAMVDVNRLAVTAAGVREQAEGIVRKFL